MVDVVYDCSRTSAGVSEQEFVSMRVLERELPTPDLKPDGWQTCVCNRTNTPSTFNT